MKAELLQKIEKGTAVVGIVGMGYVGLPLAVAFAQKGYRVIGIDVVAEKVAALNEGHSYVEDISDETLASLVQAGFIQASTSYDDLAEADAISICVPTPLRKTKDPDISYIIAAADEIARVGATGKLIVLESTTYPGTTEEVIVPRLVSNGNVVGQDVFVAFSPERIDPGRTDYTVWTTPKVIGGMTPDCLEIALKLYGKVVQQPVPVSSPATAEMVKLLENTFRAVNIALVNEVALMCDRLGLDVWEVVEAAATKPYGFMKFTPGPGVGGHCIPLDPHYLSWKLKTLNYNARFIELASDINSHMPDYVVGKVADALNGEKKAINGSRILILGVSYKPNVGDVRESPALDIIHLLQERGADVVFHDPYVSDLAYEGLDCERVELTADALHAADCVVIVTNHATYNWQFVVENTRLVVDTRNAMRGVAGNGRVVWL
ncbi:MAG: nucleotide sugar dehydrogenase [Candidatus Promineifilaceae bacterium]